MAYDYRWHPVSECLPPNNETVFIVGPRGTVDKGFHNDGSDALDTFAEGWYAWRYAMVLPDETVYFWCPIIPPPPIPELP